MLLWKSFYIFFSNINNMSRYIPILNDINCLFFINKCSLLHFSFGFKCLHKYIIIFFLLKLYTSDLLSIALEIMPHVLFTLASISFKMRPILSKMTSRRQLVFKHSEICCTCSLDEQAVFIEVRGNIALV